MPAARNKAPRIYAISELASEFGVTSRALRLYEESGLLCPHREGTKRLYSERERVRLRLILRGKRVGCSLSEIKELFDLYDSSSGEKAQLELLLEKLEERRQLLETQKQDVELALQDLARVAQDAQAALAECQASEKKSNTG